jgi:hypothetical protein
VTQTELNTEIVCDNPLPETHSNYRRRRSDLLFTLVFGPDQPVVLQLLDLPQMLPNVRGARPHELGPKTEFLRWLASSSAPAAGQLYSQLG